MIKKYILLLLAAFSASLAVSAKGLQPVAWRYDNTDITIKDETVTNNSAYTLVINSDNRAYDGDNGYAEFTVDDPASIKGIALTPDGTSLKYFIFVYSGSCIIQVDGVNENFGQVTAGDRFRIELSGANIYFYWNDVLKKTITGVSRSEEYIIQMALKSGASLSGVKTTIPIPYSINLSNDNSGYNLVHKISPQVAVSTVSLLSERHTGKYLESIDYVDGIGRLAKTVAHYASPSMKHVYQHREYDQYGREARIFLPYTRKRGSQATYTDNWKQAQIGFLADYYPDDASYGYTETQFDGSPANRVTSETGTGADWHGADGTKDAVQYEYGFNNSYMMKIKMEEASPVAKFYLAGEYGPRDLKRVRTTDENGYRFDKYTDGKGRTVVERSYVGQPKETSTYYVYDGMGNLRLVLQPEGVHELETDFGDWQDPDWTYDIPEELIYKQGFYYEYDKKGRVVRKQVPSVASESGGEVRGNTKMVYNNIDQLVLSQDGKLEEDGKWRYYKYDALGREVISGLFSEASSGQDILQVVAAPVHPAKRIISGNGYDASQSFPPASEQADMEEMTITYYDDYRFPISGSFTLPAGFTGIQAARSRGRITAVKQRVLGTETFLTTRYCYDKYGRVLQTVSDNIAGGQDIVTTEYDFTGKPEKILTQSTSSNASFTYLERYEYDHAGRLINTYGTANSGEEILVSHNSYDETGQLIETDYHDTDDKGPIQSTDYKYNIRGWLTDINDTETDDGEGDLFSMKLCYNDPSIFTTSDSYRQHNGDISAIEWKNGAGSDSHGYYFSYGRGSSNGIGLQYAFFRKNRTSGVNNNCYFRYDRNGNIAYRSIYNNGTGIDQLNYSYKGNRLIAVGDNRQEYDVNRGDFFESGEFEGIPVDEKGDPIEEYAYDLGGNMIQDLNRGISIAYNTLNLPEEVNRDGQSIKYTYSASGQKLSASVNGTPVSYYCGNVVYSATGFDYANVIGARIVNKNGSLRYEYRLTDHLGNTRAVYADTDGDGDAERLQEEAYYPFGMRIPSMSKSYSGSSDDKYLYNGKELESRLTGFHFSDYGARFYDPALGRWHSTDPMYQYASAFVYTGNNPINNIDPDGMWSRTLNGWETANANDISRFINMLQIEEIQHGIASIAQIDQFVTEEFHGTGGKLSDGSVLLSEAVATKNSDGEWEVYAHHMGKMQGEVWYFSSFPQNQDNSVGEFSFYSYKYYRERSWQERDGDFPGLSLSGFVTGEVADFLSNSKTWLNLSNMKTYSQNYYGNKYQSAKSIARNKGLAKKISSGIGAVSKGVGIYGAYTTMQEYKSGKLSSFGANYIGETDAAGILGGTYGGAYSFGTALGKAIVESNWYFNTVHGKRMW